MSSNIILEGELNPDLKNLRKNSSARGMLNAALRKNKNISSPESSNENPLMGINFNTKAFANSISLTPSDEKVNMGETIIPAGEAPASNSFFGGYRRRRSTRRSVSRKNRKASRKSRRVSRKISRKASRKSSKASRKSRKASRKSSRRH
jgi:hypothetical protein